MGLKKQKIKILKGNALAQCKQIVFAFFLEGDETSFFAISKNEIDLTL